MVKRVRAAEAKMHLSALIAEVAYGHQRIIIERRGKPLAALVGLDDLERLEQERVSAAKPRGALALLGAWQEVADQEIDALVADIYAEREKDTGRPVELEP